MAGYRQYVQTLLASGSTRLQESWRKNYPFLFERRPGELWITTMQGFLRVRVAERDLIAPER